METMGGSTSLTTTTDSAGSSSSPPNKTNNEDSLHGLKFGRKIYFEDGTPAAPKSGSSSSSTGGAKKQRSSGGAGSVVHQVPRCQVAGCNVDLSDVKAYYSRHRVCAMHSKTPTVVVAGLEQRFCQQCSRFHQLPEFDQGKRSCRRRLAGHNERRRKPQPGSMMSTHFGHHSSSIYEHSGRVGSFLMDFTAYPRDGRNAWAAARASARPPANQTITATGKFQHQWQSHPETTRSDLYLQGSAGGTRYPGPGIPPGECVTGVTDSNCALSLLSNQSWDSRNRGVGTNVFLNTQGAPIPQTIANIGPVNPFPTTSWGFKGNEAGSSSHEMLPDLGLGQISQPISSHYAGELELSQQGRRQQNMELGNSRGYNSSSQQVHWSL